MNFLKLFQASKPDRVEIEEKSLLELQDLAAKGKEAEKLQTEMQSQIKDLTAKISGLESEHKAKLDEWQAKYSNLETENATLKTEKAALEKEVAEKAALEKEVAEKDAVLQKVNKKFVAQNLPTQGAKTGTGESTIEEAMTNLFASGATSIEKNEFERMMKERNAKTDY